MKLESRKLWADKYTGSFRAGCNHLLNFASILAGLPENVNRKAYRGKQRLQHSADASADNQPGGVHRGTWQCAPPGRQRP